MQKLIFILTVFSAINANAQLINKELKLSGSMVVEEKGGPDTSIHISTHDSFSYYYNFKKPLVIVNGKRKPFDSVSAMDVNSIESVSVMKSDEARKKYGRKARAGAIIIVTKQT